jgi:hypothetical protein
VVLAFYGSDAVDHHNARRGRRSGDHAAPAED